MKKSIALSTLLISLLLLQSGKSTSIFSDTEKSWISHLNAQQKWVDTVFKSLSIEEQIAQFFMLAVHPEKGQMHQQEIIRLIKEKNIGGLIYFKSHPDTIAQWGNIFQQHAKTPLMTSIDGEWGLSMRLKGTTVFPRQLTLGAIQNDSLIYQMGKEIARQCQRIGIHVNLAPVVDVNNNPNNPVINDRSFGENRENVAKKSLAYMQGMQDKGIIACAKHFPGHGDTDKDSHKTLPIIKHHRKRLDSIELYPFKYLFERQLKSVMAAHLFIPALDTISNQAVSLSRKVTTDLLKDSLKFKGIVFSDALNMKGVSQYYPPGEVDLKAFIAGNDILLFSENVHLGISKINAAVKQKKISTQEIEQRVKKILRAKYELGLHTYKPSEENDILQDLNTPLASKLLYKLYAHAITVVNNPQSYIPLLPKAANRYACVGIGITEPNTFQKKIHQYIPQIDKYQIRKQASANDFDNLIKQLAPYDKIVVHLHQMSRYAHKKFGISEQTKLFLEHISKKKKVILVLFGSPYSLTYFQNQQHIITAYQDNALTQDITADILCGSKASKGKLPITAGKFSYGTGIDVYPVRMPYTSANKIGVDENTLLKIDSIAQYAIDLKATPGCQILVAKQGHIIYHKTFGHHTYKKSQPVQQTDVYDIASITKIMASVPVLMHLVEQEDIDINKTVGFYLNLPSSNTISTLRIKDILTHTAGLPAWIPFFKATLPDSIFDQTYQKRLSPQFPTQVAQNMYIHASYADSIWQQIIHCDINPKDINPKKTYKYSDLGYYILSKIVKKIKGKSIAQIAQSLLYKPLRMEHTTYHPKKTIPLNRIIPTEKDTSFRQQLIHGYVHDPGAAMLGGEEGHAGLFSNASDLALLMQIYLNNGYFGKHRFFSPQTIRQFTQAQDCNCRRGLGFDKPEPDTSKGSPASKWASPYAFGHSGFTGTTAWADPENELIYIFLSNRIHPYASNKKLVQKNIRTDIHSIAYKAVK